MGKVNVINRKKKCRNEMKKIKEQERLKIIGERLKNPYTSISHRFHAEFPKPISAQTLKVWQNQDEDMKLLIDYLANDKLPRESKLLKIVLNEAPNHILDNGILYRIYVPPNCNQTDPRIRLQLCTPKELRYDVLQEHHGDLSGAHYDCARVYSTLRLNYYWKGMFRDCKKWFL